MSATTTIREITGAEMCEITHWLDSYAFQATPPLPDRKEWDEHLNARKGSTYYALFEGEKAVAVVCCPTFSQNLRGKLFKMGGFAGVATHPEARRKGYVRQLMRHAFEAQVHQGRAVSCLYPFRESFYERVGFVTFPQARQAIFDPKNLHSTLKMGLEAEFKLDLSGAAYDDYRAYTCAMQPKVHGMALYEDSQKEAYQSNRSWILRAKIDGETVGIMEYRLIGDEPMNFTLRATRFYYSTSQARYLLLNWIARHIDHAGKVELWLPAYEQPGTWLADLQVKLKPAFIAPMGRILDVSGLNGLACGPGSFTAQITDPDCPWNNEIWQFGSDSGTLQITPAQKADCVLTIQGLAALLYGTNDPADFSFRNWGNPSDEVQATMRAMFPLQKPYLHEYY